jgi:hypothetical protein
LHLEVGWPESYFRSMKRSCSLWVSVVLLALPAGGSRAQDDGARAAAIADQQAAEERFQRLDSAVQGLLAAQADRDRRIEALSTEVRKAAAERAATPRTDPGAVTREEYNRLLESVKEIDRKRAEDKRQILEEIANLQTKLEKSVREAIAGAQRRAQPAPAPEKADRPERVEKKNGGSNSTNAGQEGTWYTVEKGNTLTTIINAHNEVFKKQGKKTSLKLVLEANPKLKPETMVVGQKIFIPVVAN